MIIKLLISENIKIILKEQIIKNQINFLCGGGGAPPPPRRGKRGAVK